MSVTPSSAYDDLDLIITGPDNIHWTADFKKSLYKIDISDIIYRTAPVQWLDSIELKIESNLPPHLWHKKIKPKKWLADMWESAQTSGYNTFNEYPNHFAELAKESFKSQISTWSAIRENPEGPPIIYTLSQNRISEVGNYAYGFVATAFANAVSYIWDDVPISNLNDKKVKESFGWQWEPSAKVTFVGGQSISLDPGVSDFWKWFEAAEDTGWSGSELIEFQSVEVGLEAHSNGTDAHGKYYRNFDIKIGVDNSEGRGNLRLKLQYEMNFR